MIPEISITCHSERIFINSITVEQYKKYIKLMAKNDSDKVTDAMFFNKKILQEIFANCISLEELGKADAIETLSVAKGIHFIMQDIISQKLIDIVEVEQIAKEESAFDEYDVENGYEDEQEEKSIWVTCGEIIDRLVKLSIRLLKISYSECMKEDLIELLEYLKFELDTIDESSM